MRQPSSSEADHQGRTTNNNGGGSLLATAVNGVLLPPPPYTVSFSNAHAISFANINGDTTRSTTTTPQQSESGAPEIEREPPEAALSRVLSIISIGFLQICCSALAASWAFKKKQPRSNYKNSIALSMLGILIWVCFMTSSLVYLLIFTFRIRPFDFTKIDLQRKLGQAAFDGDVAVIKQLASRGDLDLNWKDSNFYNECSWGVRDVTAVHRALVCRRPFTVDVLRELIAAGVDVNIRESARGYTALTMAAYHGDNDIVRLLLEKGGADINLKRGKEPQSALYIAAAWGNLETVRLLADKGADVNAGDENNWTALMLAAKVKNLNMARLLIEKGANVNVRAHVYTALVEAAIQKDAQMVALLLKHGADTSACAPFTKDLPLCPSS